MTHLISILSEHLLPNFLLAKEMQGQYDGHVFITTKRMGDKGMTSRFCSSVNSEQLPLITKNFAKIVR